MLNMETLPGRDVGYMDSPSAPDVYVQKVRLSILPEFLDDSGNLNQLSSYGVLASGLVQSGAEPLVVDARETVLVTRSDPNWSTVCTVNYQAHSNKGFRPATLGGNSQCLVQFAVVHLQTGIWVEQSIPWKVEVWYRTMTPSAIKETQFLLGNSDGFGQMPTAPSWGGVAKYLSALQALGLSQD